MSPNPRERWAAAAMWGAAGRASLVPPRQGLFVRVPGCLIHQNWSSFP